MDFFALVWCEERPEKFIISQLEELTVVCVHKEMLNIRTMKVSLL
jgi:hypothetical protein